jgi:putative colanic acid biosynthesis UDP-glucose lipid carrier transferase
LSEYVIFKTLDPWQSTVKTVFDKIFAAALLILFSPLLLGIALAIKLESPGPILFKQSRHGLNNTVFPIFKFRSMQVAKASETGFLQTQREDPRTTSIGKFLRRSSLDELPQLLNVLQGTMSLIGPRPHPLPLDEEYGMLIDGYSNRYRVKPGITGWAQVNGHRGAIQGVASMRSRVEHDNFYIENWSLMLDLKILLMTLRNGFVHENAY